MKKKSFNLDIKTILIVILVIIILLLRSCGGGGGSNKPGETIKVDGKKYEIIKVDTVEKVKNIVTTVTKKGKDIFHDTTIYLTIPQKVDTLQILKEFYSKNVYKDTINLNDSLGYVVLVDSISENKIFSRKFSANIDIKEKTITLFLKEPPKRQMYIGIASGVDRRFIFRTLETDLLYKDKKDRIYSLGVGIISNNPSGTSYTPYVRGGLYFKIKL